MPTIHYADPADITINPGRVRKEFDPTTLGELANDIEAHGLLHPVVMRNDAEGRLTLVAGETRMRALARIAELGTTITCAGQSVPLGQVPYVLLGELPEDVALEIELAENICRKEISWQERTEATARLYELKKRQTGTESTSPRNAVVIEAMGLPVTSGKEISRRVLLAKHLDDPDVARAPSEAKALEIVRRKVERAESAKRSVPEHAHDLMLGDSVQILPTLATGMYDVICTDPPYGIEMGRTTRDDAVRGGAAHRYEDDPRKVEELWAAVIPQLFRVAKPQAHLYMFCSLPRWPLIHEMLKSVGWWSWSRPIIWVKSTGQGMFAEWGPVYRYECIAYAVKGRKAVVKTGQGDVCVYDAVADKQHPAEKPYALLRDLLERSALQGDKVLDPFAGSGSIIPVCMDMRLQVTCIEEDRESFELCRHRIRERNAA